ncbi:hypothetical protein N0M98_29145 [Paenibacillus doosanensis]|uniref:RHS repeat-associated core domain-containing protein n=1 Tax=Paenibacillus doosanensis TaxID=1229154 RepID=UPI00217F99ED|nr:RHS repeat-associated core domain-containing protein [Paenibacillus doosanensis]MCS7464173.1 hypothetical protein [Paenibacillus doosanensis]
MRAYGKRPDRALLQEYLRARWYDPSMGRFISEDPYEGDINNPLSLNLYTYCHKSPLGCVDPRGHYDEILDQYVTRAADVQRIIELTDALDHGDATVKVTLLAKLMR